MATVAPSAAASAQHVSVSRVVIQEQIIPAVKVGTVDDEVVYAWVAPNRLIRDRLDTLKDRRVGLMSKSPADLESFLRGYAARKFAPGTCDSGTFVAELVKLLTSVPLPSDAQTLLDYVEVKFAKRLATVACPSQELAFTNFLYVSPEDGHMFVRQDAKPSYVRMGHYIYCVEAHPSVAKDSLGLNGVHRTTHRVRRRVFHVACVVFWGGCMGISVDACAVGLCGGGNGGTR